MQLFLENLDKFNTINSQLIQYWWYWFCTIPGFGARKLQAVLVYIVTLILVILPVTVFLFFAQKWFVPTGAIHIYNNSILMLIQKIVSSVFGLIHIVSILTVIVFFAYLIFRK